MGKAAPDALLQAITPDNIQYFKAQEIANSLWAYATMGKVAPDALFQAITPDKVKTFNAQGIHQFYLAFQYFEKPFPFDFQHAIFREVQNNRSKAEDIFFQMLGRKDVMQSTYIPDIASIVDGYHKATKTIIQIDGPTHFDADGTLLPASKLLDAILKQNGYTVFRFKVVKRVSKNEDVEVQALLAHLGDVAQAAPSREEAAGKGAEKAKPVVAGTSKPVKSQKQNKRQGGWKTLGKKMTT